MLQTYSCALLPSSTPLLFVLVTQVTAHPLVHHILLIIFRLFILLLSSSTSRAYIRVVALFDYVARTDRELTFRAGDIMMITEMLSDDWSVPLILARSLAFEYARHHSTATRFGMVAILSTWQDVLYHNRMHSF